MIANKLMIVQAPLDALLPLRRPQPGAAGGVRARDRATLVAVGLMIVIII